VAPLRPVWLIAIILPLPVAADSPERSLGPVETRPATAYVSRLLSPARPVASGKRLDLWVARELSPLFDGELVAEEWRGALELNVPWATQETTAKGFPPRVVFCLARQRDADGLLLGCIVQDATRETTLAPRPQPASAEGATAPTDELSRWAGVDHLFVGLYAKGAERPVLASLRLCRGATVAEDGLLVRQGAVGEIAETGWAAELQLSSGALDIADGDEVGLFVQVHNGAGPDAAWPAGARADDPATWGRMVTRRPGG